MVTHSKAKDVFEVRGLVTKFGDHVVHEDLSLNLREGEVLGVVGGSGSGKSVLMNVILGLVTPTAGEIKILGQKVDENLSSRSHMGVLFQHGALFSSLTVLENIAFPLQEIARLSPEVARALAAVRLRMVGLEEEAGEKLPAELSGGMIKRAALARALALDPSVLFLDEPTAGLDPIAATGFDELLRELSCKLTLSVFMITHDLDTLTQVCDRVAVLVNRKVIAGTLEEIRTYPDPWVHAYFGGRRGERTWAKEDKDGKPH